MFRIFRRREPPRRPELTNDAFARWLRAQRPPFGLFLGLSEIEQEQLALLGDEYVQDVAVAVGYAVADPALASAGLEGDSVEADVTRTEALARKVAESILGRQAAASPRISSDAPTMSGFQERAAQRRTERQQADAGRPFLGAPSEATS